MKSKISLLFLGRKSCEKTKKIIDFIKTKNINLDTYLVEKRSDKISKDILNWSGDYIISFRNLFILPKNLLNRAIKYPINIHPGPPNYRGSGCFNWALYENAKYFGVTSHIMDEKIDSGKIIECRRFKIHPKDDLEKLISKTHNLALKVTIDLISGILKHGHDFIEIKLRKFKNEKWSGKNRSIKLIDELQNIKLNVSKKELSRIIRATNFRTFKPYVELYGLKFYFDPSVNKN